MPSQSAPAPTSAFPWLVRVPAGDPCPGGRVVNSKEQWLRLISQRMENRHPGGRETCPAVRRALVLTARAPSRLQWDRRATPGQGPSGRFWNARFRRQVTWPQQLERTPVATGVLSWEEGTHCRKCWVLPASGVGPTDLPALAVTLDRQAVPGDLGKEKDWVPLSGLVVP